MPPRNSQPLLTGDAIEVDELVDHPPLTGDCVRFDEPEPFAPNTRPNRGHPFIFESGGAE